MESSEPDSSPIAAICSTMLGNRPEFCIATVSAVPVDTSPRIRAVPSTNTWLPDAPPTESSASTRGTPAANMVARVRVQRAMVAFSMTGPKIGSLSTSRSITICIFFDRFHACRKA